tara:strand:+ start:17026 stop:17586 length:561 start_codon:yes stop_codon:yes gene_type:complete
MLRLSFLFLSCICLGQIQKTKRWDASGLKDIDINCAWASSIRISTHTKPTIEINYQKEGKYQYLHILREKINGKRFYLKEYQSPNYIKPVNKLSVHKDFANMLVIKIPKNLNLHLTAKETQLDCSGVFEKINLVLEHGKATLKIYEPKEIIQSLSADLHFYGLHLDQLPKTLLVSSARGNIEVHPN